MDQPIASPESAQVAEPTADPSTEDGFVRWVAPHWAAMSRLAARSCAGVGWEDVLQDALTEAWRKRRQFDVNRGSARNWLLMITADQGRKARRSSSRGLRTSLLEEAARTQVSATASEHDVDIERAIDRLSDRQQMVINLYYFLDLSVADTAAVMACTEGTVKSTLADARNRLRNELGEEYR